MEKVIKVWLKYYPVYLSGLWGTLWISAVTVFLGALLGMVVALMRMSRLKILRTVFNVYVEILRGTPILLQLYFFWIGLPKLVPFELTDTQCIVAALAVNASAFISEIIRAGIQSIDGGQTEYVRVPFADQGLNKIPDGVTDRQALLVGDVLATGFWAARISEITAEDTVLILGAGPTGICTLLCVMLKQPKRIIVCEKDESRVRFINKHYPEVLTVSPDECLNFVRTNSDHGGADVVLEVAGAESTFRLAWECARPNAIVTVVALYDKAQILPLPDMYGKNLTFKTGGVDGCNCEETLRLIAEGKLDTEPLITHTYPLSRIEEAYELFENRRDNVIKVAVECS